MSRQQITTEKERNQQIVKLKMEFISWYLTRFPARHVQHDQMAMEFSDLFATATEGEMKLR